MRRVLIHTYIQAILFVLTLHTYRSGSKTKGATAKCATCEGRGVRFIVKQLGPGMIQQMQAVCSDCGGKGRFKAHLFVFFCSIVTA